MRPRTRVNTWWPAPAARCRGSDTVTHIYILLTTSTIVLCSYLVCGAQEHKEGGFDLSPANGAGDLADRLGRGIVVLDNVHFFNGSFHTRLESTGHFSYHGIPVRNEAEMPDKDTIAVDTLHNEKSVLVVAKPFQLKTWHNNLFDESVPVFRILHEMNLWHDEDLKQYVTAYFANSPGWDSSHTARTLRELLELHIPHVYLDSESFNRHYQKPMHAVFWSKIVLIGSDVRPQWEALDNDMGYVVTYLLLRDKTRAMVEAKGELEVLPTPEGKRRVVLVQREQQTKRSFVNDTHVMDVLQGLSDQSVFTAHTCQSWFFDQFNMMQSGDVVVAAHGACLSNMLWMRHGSALVEIFPFHWNSDVYRNVASVLGIRYYNIMSAPTSREHFPELFSNYCSESSDATNMTEADCLHTKDYGRAQCCSHFVRDQRIIVDKDVLQEQVAKALDPHHQPTCCDVPFGKVKLFHCS